MLSGFGETSQKRKNSSVSTSMTGLPKFKGVGTNTSLGDLEEDDGRDDVLQESLSHEMAEVRRQERLVKEANEARNEMKTEMAQLQEALIQEKAKHERYVRGVRARSARMSPLTLTYFKRGV